MVLPIHEALTEALNSFSSTWFLVGAASASAVFGYVRLKRATAVNEETDHRTRARDLLHAAEHREIRLSESLSEEDVETEELDRSLWVAREWLSVGWSAYSRRDYEQAAACAEKARREFDSLEIQLARIIHGRIAAVLTKAWHLLRRTGRLLSAAFRGPGRSRRSSPVLPMTPAPTPGLGNSSSHRRSLGAG